MTTTKVIDMACRKTIIFFFNNEIFFSLWEGRS
jgi:hypothetical protein